MAILSEIFAIASDDEATSLLTAGARVGSRDGDPADAVIETTGLTSNEIDILHAQLTGRDMKSILHSDKGTMVAFAGDEGPWVERIRPELCDLIAALPEEALLPTASAWVADHDLDGVLPTDAADLLRDWGALARSAKERGDCLYIWTSL